MSDGPVILIIDDEAQIRRMLRLSLEAHGFTVKEATTAQEGLQQASLARPDLIILDLNLPDKGGLETLKDIRGWSRTPVIVLSVRNSEQDKIELLDSGADDYLTKPFGMGELLARIRAALRHITPDTADGVFSSGGLVIDFSRRIVTRQNEEIKLTPTEYSLLKLLACNAGKVLTHNQIIDELWGLGSQPDTSYLRVYVLQLRKKIEKDPSNPGILITEPGVGYRLLSI
ncbi:MAG TPA: response regulator [Spirochaetota bacterium]|nr:response regulator [Spirochaetota bacterium]